MFRSPSSEFVYVRTYSRWVEELGRRENWPETVQRYITFVKKHLGDKIPPKVLRKIEEKILAFEVMPSMRFLWAAGEPAELENVTIYNCAFSAISHVDAFSEALYILMCGTGYGFSVESKHVGLLPTVPLQIASNGQVYEVEDSKAGWADSLKVLINLLYSGQDPEMRYNKIRPAGARLKTMGGRASGPGPLAQLHSFTKGVFYNARGRQLTSQECHDILCEVAQIVVVGGVRRSSEMSLSDLHDKEMRGSKTGNFPVRRYMANNSAVYNSKPDIVTFMNEWAALIASGSGERGIFNLEAARAMAPKRRDSASIVGTNPCQPSFAKISLANGSETTMGELKVGDVLLNANLKETTVVKKWSTGIKPVYAYGFENGLGGFIGTANHRVVIKNRDGELVKEQIDKVWENRHIMGMCTTEGYQIVTSKVYLGDYDVFDITVDDDTHTYITNGAIVSNCGEIQLRSEQFCNLSEVVARAEDDMDTMLEKVETATWMGVIQACFTNFPYLGPNWAKNCNEERLLGVSITGQFDAPHLFHKEALKAYKSKAIKVAKKASEIMGIPMPAAITCVKPSGTVSQLVNSASGLHPRFAKHYIRRYRISSTDPLFKMIRDQGLPVSPENGQRKQDYVKAVRSYDTAIDSGHPEVVAMAQAKSSCPIFDNEGWTQDKVNTWIVSFPMASPENAITVEDMSALDQLDWYKKIQKNWCEHNASITVYVKPEEWLSVGDWVYKNWEIVNGISFLPVSDHVYEQAPYEKITKEEYDKMSKIFPNIDYSQLGKYEMEDNTEGAKSLACAAGNCEV